ncbi:MAG: LLM class flavin-dependent oxidoreductase, partial [Streptosporangiaceae bacterium]
MCIEIIGMVGTQEVSESRGSLDGPQIDPGYLTRFARAHEAAGFDRVLIGYGATGADGFAVAAHVLYATSALRVLIAHRPGFVAPTLVARKLATLDQLTGGGRVAIRHITGGDELDQQRDGDFADHDRRYARTAEFMSRALLDYVDIGVTTILIRGYDPYDDAIDYGRHLLPLVREEVARRERAVAPAELVTARPGDPDVPGPEPAARAAPPGRALLGGRAAEHLPVAAGAAGHLPGRRLRARPRPGRHHRRGDLHPRRVHRGRAGVLPPDVLHVAERGFRTQAEKIAKLAGDNDFTLRQTVQHISAPRPTPFAGSPETVATVMQEWFEGRALDGFNIHIGHPAQFRRFTDEVVPILTERSLVRAGYATSTLRGHPGPAGAGEPLHPRPPAGQRAGRRPRSSGGPRPGARHFGGPGSRPPIVWIFADIVLRQGSIMPP